MQYKNILITGGSGRLGKSLLASELKNRNCYFPTQEEMDIKNSLEIKKYLIKNKFDAVIHCAALATVSQCEKDPIEAVETNIIGTANLVKEVMGQEIRFIYISTDYVYPGTNGPYSEDSQTIPFTLYGWTKLAGECAVKMLKNHCIIRTTFFDPKNIAHDTAPVDSYKSSLPLPELAKAISKLLDSAFIGTINVGSERESVFNILKQYRPDIRGVKLEEISRGLKNPPAKDSSLDISLWKKISGSKI